MTDELPAFERLRLPAIPEVIERAIVTPHEHEGPKNSPLWLIWKVQRPGGDNVPYFPQLDCVCDSPKSARYHVQAILHDSYGKTEVYVERIPANHRFGSSLEDLQMRTHMALWKARLKRVDGD